MTFIEMMNTVPDSDLKMLLSRAIHALEQRDSEALENLAARAELMRDHRIARMHEHGKAALQKFHEEAQLALPLQRTLELLLKETQRNLSLFHRFSSFGVAKQGRII